MKRLTKEQYEMIADAIAHVRKTNQDFEHVSNEDKKQREIMADQIVSELCDSFNRSDNRFNWNLFATQAK